MPGAVSRLAAEFTRPGTAARIGGDFLLHPLTIHPALVHRTSDRHEKDHDPAQLSACSVVPPREGPYSARPSDHSITVAPTCLKARSLPSTTPRTLIPARSGVSASPRDAGPKIQTVRLMAPFSMSCQKYGEFIYKGRKFNARKEHTDEKYCAITIFRFYSKIAIYPEGCCVR